MAATYDPLQPNPYDRVRRMIGDRSAPFYYQNEEITVAIDSYGSGEVAEVRAAIELLQGDSRAGTSTTQKQGSWSRTQSATNSINNRLESLKQKLNDLLLAGGDSFSGVGVAESDFPYPQDLPYLPASCRPISPIE